MKAKFVDKNKNAVVARCKAASAENRMEDFGEKSHIVYL